MLTPENAKNAMAKVKVPTRKLRFPNKCRSTTGCLSVSSQGMRKAIATSAVTAALKITGELNQSFSLPLSNMNCRLPTPTTSSARPTTSMGSFTMFDSRWRRIDQLAMAEKAPTGRLM